MGDISERARRLVGVAEPFRCEAVGNTYHSTSNPEGVISLRSAQNRLCGDLMLEQIKKLDLSECDGGSLLRYQDGRGIPALRRATADFLKDITKSPQDLDPDKIRFCNGLTALIEVLVYTLCDDGDTILAPSPLYTGIVRDAAMRPNVTVHLIHLSSKPGSQGEEPYELTVQDLERGYAEATQQGKQVKALILINPTNPLGTVYNKSQILSYLNFCKKHNLHVILDEIYLCSVYDQTRPMCSVLSLPESQIPDLERTHFMWSFGKDFSFNACHLGMLYSWNESVLEAVRVLADYHLVSSLIQLTFIQILGKKEWLHDVYLKTCHERLRQARDIAMATLDEMGVAYIKPTAGFFIWANFNKFLGASTYAEEKSLSCHLISCGVSMLPSFGFYGNEPGWFRVLFCVPLPELKEGLRRLKEGCLSYVPGEESKGAGNLAGDLASDLAGDLAIDLAGDLADVQILGAASGESLESLVRSFQVSVKNSDWLKENTADKWSKENPELSKAWMDELEKNAPQ